MPRTAHSTADVLTALAQALRKLRVPWYVFGAQALVLRGSPRATADLDVTVLLGTLPTSRLVAVLTSAGFALQFDSEDFVAATRVLPVFHKQSRFPVDIVLGGPGLEERFAAAAEPIRVGRQKIPVASSTHLVLMKVLAGRPKDIEDAATLLAARKSEIDAEELDELALDLAKALDETDVLAHLTEARRRASNGVRARKPMAKAASPRSTRKPKTRKPKKRS